MSKKIKVVVAGAAGRMGQESVRAILKETNAIELVGVVGHKGADYIGKDIGQLVGLEPLGLTISDNLKDTLQRTSPQVLLDFTVPSAIYANAIIALECGVSPIIGATGLSDEDLLELRKKAEYYQSCVLIAPNFAIGVLLMIETAKKIIPFMPQVEIIETHHDKKLDAPSGTAIKTAKELAPLRPNTPKSELVDNQAPRGEIVDGIRVHSLRLTGALAHQEIIFGAEGQTLTIRHDALSRSAYMPGVILAIKEITKHKGLIYGLEKVIFADN